MTQSFSRRSCGADFRESDRAGRYRGPPLVSTTYSMPPSPQVPNGIPYASRIDERVELELDEQMCELDVPVVVDDHDIRLYVA